MVFVKLLGILDIIAAIVMILLHYSVGTWRLTLLFAVYLLLKAFAFRGNVHSILDGAIGIYMILLLFGFHSFLTFVAAIYIFQKAIFSLF